MKRSSAALLSSILSSLVAAQPSNAPGVDRFDGAWTVTMSCPSNTEKTAALGYKRQFPAQVTGGVLQGEVGAEGAPGWLRLDGRIGADGGALLDAHGRTGNSDYAVNHPPPSSPYAYRVEAHFDAAHGTGKRLEQRVCSFVFDRK